MRSEAKHCILSRVLNTFLAWSLIRSYLPFLPQGFRSSLQYFERTLYRVEKSPPNWYFCAKLVKSWMPLAVDVLQNYPDIQLVFANEFLSPFKYLFARLFFFDRSIPLDLRT